MRLPIITAHTGCMNTPDNSLESLNSGLQSGADIVEVDVGATKDGVPVLFHDNKVILAGHGECKLADLTFDQLKADEIIDGHTGEKRRIVSLAEILPVIKASKTRVNLDVKSDSCIEPMVKLVIKENMLEQTLVSGAEASRAKFIQNHFPQMKKLLNATSKLFKETDSLSAVKKTCEDASDACCIGININHIYCSEELLNSASSYNLPVYVWTVNQETDMRRMLELGVQSITTRNVPLLLQVYRAFKASSV